MCSKFDPEGKKIVSAVVVSVSGFKGSPMFYPEERKIVAEDYLEKLILCIDSFKYPPNIDLSFNNLRIALWCLIWLGTDYYSELSPLGQDIKDEDYYNLLKERILYLYKEIKIPLSFIIHSLILKIRAEIFRLHGIDRRRIGEIMIKKLQGWREKYPQRDSFWEEIRFIYPFGYKHLRFDLGRYIRVYQRMADGVYLCKMITPIKDYIQIREKSKNNELSEEEKDRFVAYEFESYIYILETLLKDKSQWQSVIEILDNSLIQNDKVLVLIIEDIIAKTDLEKYTNEREKLLINYSHIQHLESIYSPDCIKKWDDIVEEYFDINTLMELRFNEGGYDFIQG